MSEHMRKRPIKSTKELKKVLMEKISMLNKKEDLLALNNVVEKYIPFKNDSLTPSEVFGNAWDSENLRRGKILRGLRFREGLTQIQLAKLLRGVKQSNISAWESGKEDIPSKRIEQLNELFNTDIEKLVLSKKKY